MVEIVCRAPKQLIILECTQYPSIEALAKTIATIIRTGEPVILKWAEGVVLSYSLLSPTTDGLLKEFLEGRIYWSDVVFALMPEYKSTVRVGTLDVPVIDGTPNPILREAAKWMKASAQGSITRSRNPSRNQKVKSLLKSSLRMRDAETF